MLEEMTVYVKDLDYGLCEILKFRAQGDDLPKSLDTVDVTLHLTDELAHFMSKHFPTPHRMGSDFIWPMGEVEPREKWLNMIIHELETDQIDIHA